MPIAAGREDNDNDDDQAVGEGTGTRTATATATALERSVQETQRETVYLVDDDLGDDFGIVSGGVAVRPSAAAVAATAAMQRHDGRSPTMRPS